jgi:uncharacterized protein (TIGR03086 family)
MDEPTTVVSRIKQALDMTARTVDRITDAQWSAPTPCDDWDVRDVLNHTVGGMRIFTAQLTGKDPGADQEADWLGDDPRGRFTAAADADRSAWGSPDAPAMTVTISLGALPGPMAGVVHLTEIVVHGVDLAVATGHEQLIDQQLCHGLLGTMRAMGVDAYRVPGVFGPEVGAPETGAPQEQLAAFLGRDLTLVKAGAR